MKDMEEIKDMEKLVLLAADSDSAKRCHEVIGGSHNDQSTLNKYRNIFMSDRDRILYCKSFLRLSGKTQVYAPSTGDHQRTRLTHTLEVSQIARTISHALGLDCDLTEAIALGHDIGHTPFGHAGERMLHEIMTPTPTNAENSLTVKSTTIFKLSKNEKETQKYIPFYGFKHNLQSVRCIVEDLESKSVKFGLDLTNYTLWGIMNHSSYEYKKDRVSTTFTKPSFYDRYMQFWSRDGQSVAWSFEALVVAEADEIAQMHHDLEDAIRCKAVSNEKVLELLSKLTPLMDDEDKKTLERLKIEQVSKEYMIANVSKIIVNTLVTVLVRSSKKNLLRLIERYGEKADDDAVTDVSAIFEKSFKDSEIKYSISYDDYEDNYVTINKEKLQKNSDLIKKFQSELSKKVLYTYDVQRSDSKGKYIIKNLFEAYYTNPQQLPDSALKNLYKALIEDGYCFDTKTKYYKIEGDELRKEVYNAVTGIRKDINNNITRDILIMRIICDYIAGMTDSFAIDEYEKLYG